MANGGISDVVKKILTVILLHNPPSLTRPLAHSLSLSHTLNYSLLGLLIPFCYLTLPFYFPLIFPSYIFSPFSDLYLYSYHFFPPFFFPSPFCLNANIYGGYCTTRKLGPEWKEKMKMGREGKERGEQ